MYKGLSAFLKEIDMNDGHSGVENRKVNEGATKLFQFVLSFLKVSDNRGFFILHAKSNIMYSAGLPPKQFLTMIGLRKYDGPCPFHGDECFYRVLVQQNELRVGFRFTLDIQTIHESFKRFVENIDALFELYQKEQDVLGIIGLSKLKREVLDEPFELSVGENDLPLWIHDAKFPKLAELEKNRMKLQAEITDLEEYLPLLSATGDPLRDSVIKALRLCGLQAKPTEPGFTVDILANTPDEAKSFGIEVTGTEGPIKKDSKKLTQLQEFDRIKEKNEKVILIANTYRNLPIDERKSKENFTVQVVDYLRKYPFLLMTGLDLYKMAGDIISGTKKGHELVAILWNESGVLKY